MIAIFPFLALTLAPLPQAKAPSPTRSITPPSTVKIAGGATYIGSTPDEITDLLKEATSHQVRARAFDAETPQVRENVQDFYLMLSEVTNEQYLAFVEATGAPPPLQWADPKALEAARLEHAKLEQERIEEAKKNNQKPPERTPFDEAAWWERSWKELPWAVTDKLRTMPVVYVNYSDALAYCRWAGMRLPTEFEFQRAARGSGKDPYPWGDKWDKDANPPLAAISEVRGLNAPVAIGSFPGGTTKEGLLDLIGNVWEWTSSPYSAYKGFKNNEYRVGKSKDEVLKPVASWDPDRRVVVGGSFEADHYVSRTTVRRGTMRSEETLGLGFRAAASVRSALDIVEFVLKEDVMRSDYRPEGIGYSTVSTIGMDSWLKAPSVQPNAPAGYEVVRGYQHIAFVPVDKVNESQEANFARDSLVVPHQLGFLSTSEAMLEPALPAGLYFVAYRGAGKPPRTALKAEGGDDKKGVHAVLGNSASGVQDQGGQATQEAGLPAWMSQIDIEKECFLFFDVKSGELAATMPVLLCKFDKASGPGSFAFVDETIWETVTDAKGKEERVQKIEKRLQLDASIETPLRGRVLHLQMKWQTAPELAEFTWRH